VPRNIGGSQITDLMSVSNDLTMAKLVCILSGCSPSLMPFMWKMHSRSSNWGSNVCTGAR
jgi:hypothetical protein